VRCLEHGHRFLWNAAWKDAVDGHRSVKFEDQHREEEIRVEAQHQRRDKRRDFEDVEGQHWGKNQVGGSPHLSFIGKAGGPWSAKTEIGDIIPRSPANLAGVSQKFFGKELSNHRYEQLSQFRPNWATAWSPLEIKGPAVGLKINQLSHKEEKLCVLAHVRAGSLRKE
jgi:hypothetical protein